MHLKNIVSSSVAAGFSSCLLLSLREGSGTTKLFGDKFPGSASLTKPMKTARFLVLFVFY